MIQKSKIYLLAICISVIIVISYTSLYTIKVDEQVIITQFGSIVDQPVTKPGLHFKIPFFQKNHYLPNHRVFELSIGPSANEIIGYGTILIKQLVRWKIQNPINYFVNLGDKLEIREPIIQALESSLSETIEANGILNLMNGHPNSGEKFIKIRNDAATRVMIRANDLLKPKGIEIIGLDIKLGSQRDYRGRILSIKY